MGILLTRQTAERILSGIDWAEGQMRKKAGPGRTPPPRFTITDLDVIRVTNQSTDRDFERFEIIGLGDPSIALDDDHPLPIGRTFRGLTTVPKFGKWALLLEKLPKKDGTNIATAFAAVGGVVPARLRHEISSHREYADVGRPNIPDADTDAERTGDGRFTLRSRFAGHAKILWAAPDPIDGTDTTPPTRWAWVRLGNWSPICRGTLQEVLHTHQDGDPTTVGRADFLMALQREDGTWEDGNDDDHEIIYPGGILNGDKLPVGRWCAINHEKSADLWNLLQILGCSLPEDS